MEGIGEPGGHAHHHHSEEGGGGKFELICGLVLTLFAAVLAIAELQAGNFRSEELISYNEKANAYSWYNTKGIKQSLLEGQRDLLKSLLDAKSIQKEQVEGVQADYNELNKTIARYKKEKNEILEGSAKVGKENWVQDVDGVMGKVKGAKEWEERGKALGEAREVFDHAALYLHIGLVIGAISLVMRDKKFKYAFFFALVVLGIVGTIYGLQAYMMAIKV